MVEGYKGLRCCFECERRGVERRGGGLWVYVVGCLTTG